MLAIQLSYILSNVTEYTYRKLSPSGLDIDVKFGKSIAFILTIPFVLRIVNEHDGTPSFPHNDR